jgi:hypothetical protein
LVNLKIDWEGYIVTNELKVLVIEQVLDVGAGAGKEIIEANDIRPTSRRRSHNCDPRKPEPPVTRIRYWRCIGSYQFEKWRPAAILTIEVRVFERLGNMVCGQSREDPSITKRSLS